MQQGGKLNIWKRNYCLFFSFCLWCTPASSEDTFKISVIDWCPFICPDNPNKPGILVEYVQAIYEGSGYEINMEVYPWSRAIVYALDGTSDALLAPTKNEAPGMVFPRLELSLQTLCFFTLSDNPWVYKGVKSLSNKHIIYPQDALPETLVKKNIHVTFTPKAYTKDFNRQVSSMLKSRRIEIVLAAEYAMSSHLKLNQLSNLITSAGCLPPEKIYLAFTPNPSNKSHINHLIKIYNKRIKILIKQQLLKDLLAKYQVQ